MPYILYTEDPSYYSFLNMKDNSAKFPRANAVQSQVAPAVCCYEYAIEEVAAQYVSPELDKLTLTLDPAMGRTGLSAITVILL